MGRFAIFFCFYLLSGIGFAQSNLLLEEEFDFLVKDWLDWSDQLRAYEGIDLYCTHSKFRESVNHSLETMHHYDSIIMIKLRDPDVMIATDLKEQKKTLKDVYKLESEYSMADFIDQMKSSCEFRNDLEQNADRYRNGVGANSYDAQVLLLETDNQRYLNHIDKLVLKIRSHLYVLHMEN